MGFGQEEIILVSLLEWNLANMCGYKVQTTKTKFYGGNILNPYTDRI
jgi:hypothetical protein